MATVPCMFVSAMNCALVKLLRNLQHLPLSEEDVSIAGFADRDSFLNSIVDVDIEKVKQDNFLDLPGYYSS